MRPALRGTAQLDGFLKDLRAFCYCTLCIVVIQAKTGIDFGRSILFPKGKTCRHWTRSLGKSSGSVRRLRASTLTEPAGEVDVQRGGLLQRRYVQIEPPRGRRDRPTLKDQRYQNYNERNAEKHRCVRQPGEDRNDREEDRDGPAETDP